MSKEVILPLIGKVILTKRRASRHMRLRVDHTGVPHVSLPFWAPYYQALKFVALKQEWIISQQTGRSPKILQSEMRIGKTHRLKFSYVPNSRLRTRVIGNEATVYYATQETDQNVQIAAEKLVIRVLKQQAEQLLPQRLSQLAHIHNCSYSEVKIAKMRSRWGSCNSNKLITLNCYLMQLSWELIDYVLLHELAHTKEMSHGQSFWELLESFLPDFKERRKAMKRFHPHILAESMPEHR